MSNPRPSDGILATLPAATLQLYYTETGSTQAMHRRHSSTPGDGKIHFVNEEDGSPTRLKESPSRRKTFIRKIRTSIFKRKDDEEIPANVRRVSMPAGSLPALDTEAQPHHRTSITSSSPHRFIKRRTVSRQASMPGLSSDSVNGEKAGVTEPSTNVPVSNEEERTTSRGHRASSASTSRSSETASSSVATPEQHTTELHAEHQLVTSDSSSMKEPNIPFPSNSPSRPPSQSSVKASSHSHVHPHINRIRPTPGMRSVSLISRHSFDTASTDSIMETVDEDASFQPFCLPEDAVPVRIRAVSESNLPPSTSLIMVPKMTRSASDGSNDSSHPQGGATVHQAMSVPNLARINVVPPSPLVPVGLYKEEKGVQTSPVTQEFSVFIPPKSVEEAIETIRKINISEEVQTEPVPKSSAATQVQPKLESTGSQAQPQVVSSLTQTDSAITTTSTQSQVECCEELVFSALFNAASRLRYRFAGYHHHVGIRDFYKPTVVAVATVGVFAMVMPVASRIFRH